MPDLTPAPGSTATCAPRAAIFLTVSGVAATRGSPGSVSAAIAIFMSPPTTAGRCGRTAPDVAPERASRSGQEISQQDQDDDDGDDGPFYQRKELIVHLLVFGVVPALRRAILGSATV